MSDIAVLLSDDERTVGDVVLELRGVSVHFGGIKALMEVDLTVRHGDMVAVIGPNGAGKTTMLNLICGLNATTMSGEVLLYGRPITGWRPSAIAAAGVGRSFQHPPLLDQETAVENIVTGMHNRAHYGMLAQAFRPRRVARAEAELRSRALLMLDLLGIRTLADRAVGGMAYGQRKLIDIVRAVASGAPLVLLDEPTSGLDFTEQQKVRDILLALRVSQKVTVLVVEHHMDVVRATATRVIGLQAGIVVAQGQPSEVLDSEVFRQAVVGVR
jgi:ABC-type branched-subunit amino acid transport system ATPase component